MEIGCNMSDSSQPFKHKFIFFNIYEFLALKNFIIQYLIVLLVFIFIMTKKLIKNLL
jgi:hypothetical protein